MNKDEATKANLRLLELWRDDSADANEYHMYETLLKRFASEENGGSFGPSDLRREAREYRKKGWIDASHALDSLSDKLHEVD